MYSSITPIYGSFEAYEIQANARKDQCPLKDVMLVNRINNHPPVESDITALSEDLYAYINDKNFIPPSHFDEYKERLNTIAFKRVMKLIDRYIVANRYTIVFLDPIKKIIADYFDSRDPTHQTKISIDWDVLLRAIIKHIDISKPLIEGDPVTYTITFANNNKISLRDEKKRMFGRFFQKITVYESVGDNINDQYGEVYIYLPDGERLYSKYVGGFENDNFHGHGTWTLYEHDGMLEEKYIGAFENGNSHGHGTETRYCDDGAVVSLYVGAFFDDDYHGHGT